MTAPALQLERVVKQYGGLRPLRIAALEVRAGERVAISQLDAAAAATLVNLATGAVLPEEGVVRVFGQATSEIPTGDQWLSSLDRFGIVSPRAVVLDDATLQQNLAMPFSLQIDPVPRDIAERVAALAAECEIELAVLGDRVSSLSPDVRARLHFARAIALNPHIVILEHPGADLSDRARVPLARVIAGAAQARGASLLAITQDQEFARIVAHRSLQLDPSTGAFKPAKRGWF